MRENILLIEGRALSLVACYETRCAVITEVMWTQHKPPLLMTIFSQDFVTLMILCDMCISFTVITTIKMASLSHLQFMNDT